MRRAEDDADRAIVQAWHIAAFSGAASVGKLPDLMSVLARRTQGRGRQSVAAQRARLALVGEHLGVGTRPISEAAKDALRRLRERDGR